MKQGFEGYYPLTKDDYATIWEDVTVVFDTNVLLNLYSYSPSTSKELLELFGEIKGKIWLPHQVALEYHRNRSAKILRESKQYTETINKISKIVEELATVKSHPYISVELSTRFKDVIDEIRKELTDGKKSTRDLLEFDLIRDKLTQLFTDRIGKETVITRLQEIYKEGKVRFQEKIPPGFKDIDKPEPGCYGDLVLWNQLMEHAESTKRPVIFVTEDLKEDWWDILDKEYYLGPRPELVHEFQSKTKQLIVICTTEEFTKIAAAHQGKLSVDAETEIRSASQVEKSLVASELVSSVVPVTYVTEPNNFTTNPPNFVTLTPEKVSLLKAVSAVDALRTAESSADAFRVGFEANSVFAKVAEHQKMLDSLNAGLGANSIFAKVAEHQKQLDAFRVGFEANSVFAKVAEHQKMLDSLNAGLEDRKSFLGVSERSAEPEISQKDNEQRQDE